MPEKLTQTDVVLRLQKAMRETVTPGMKMMLDLEINRIKRMTSTEFEAYIEKMTKPKNEKGGWVRTRSR